MIKHARAMGLKGIAITDHETAEGAKYAKQINPFSDFEIIVGQEVRTEVGDIIGLFIEDNLRQSTFKNVCTEIRGQGGIVVLPHPFKKKMHVDPEIVKQVDCVEVFNARIRQEENHKAFELCREMGKPLIVGSDAHTLSEVGRATLVTTVPGLNKAHLLRQNDFTGEYSPRYVHYISALIGNYSKGTLMQLIVKRGLPHELRARFGW